MSSLLRTRVPHVLLGALVGGIALANLTRVPLGAALIALTVAPLATAVDGERRVVVLGIALMLLGLWWGSARLDALDRSVLAGWIGTSETARVVVTAPPRRGQFELRVVAQARRWGTASVRETVLLELPLGRPPPQGAVIDVLGELVPPRGPQHGFDERTYLRRHGIHVVLRGDRWRRVGLRGGVGGLGDRLRVALAGSVAIGLHGERRALLEGVVLGDDGGLDANLRQRFRASGLYHLLAVSGQNVALVAGAVLGLGWLLGLPRVVSELGALAGMGAYVLAVGPQPSVIRAGVAGALGSLAWLAARQRDRWYFLLLGGLALVAPNPYTVFDAGFQLSFAAVIAIFTLVPRIERVLEGYPLPKGLRTVIAVSTACGVATAPVSWLQFHAVPLLTVPANALAAPAVVPLLGLSLGAAALAPVAPPAALALAWVNGWCAAYLAGCARLVGGLPLAQIRSTQGGLVLLAGAIMVSAYAWRRWPMS